FPEEVMKAAMAVQDRIPASEIKRRKDLRDVYTFTIDPASAKDFDDAISIIKKEDGYELYVHIADVAHYVKLESVIFAEAVNRGNSYYFPKRVLPMLPEKLSNMVCSLRPDEDKLTMTVYTKFDKKGMIRKQELMETVIRSNYRLAYEEVDNLFAGDRQNLPDELIDVLYTSRDLSRLLTKFRKENGYIFFDLPEIQYEYDQEGFIKTFTLAEETESHKLIENFMLVANEYTASKLTQLSPTTMYRIHEDPDFAKIERLTNTLSHYGIKFLVRENLNKSYQALLDSLPTPEHHIVFDRMVLRSMKKAKYSTEHLRHFGLAIETYTHFTSPIRRLCDLIIHHLCKIHILKSVKETLTVTQVKHYAAVSSEKELVADEAEREIEKVYNRAYMKDNIGEKYSGLVIGVNSSGLIVRLNELPITGVLKVNASRGSRWDFKDQELRLVNRNSGYYYQLLDKVKVQVMDVSDDIYFELSQDSDAHIHTVTVKSSATAVPQKKKRYGTTNKVKRSDSKRKK
ncbi:MAG: VacB/RNase II family 3'-5' exoribonuclease, partial [Candidatus Cloacimonadaceae bacterium]|nr:VacB/RNase II family 3'-5' exoribonuclease [Candidatus Cloacimonadaceae bacterium]